MKSSFSMLRRCYTRYKLVSFHRFKSHAQSTIFVPGRLSGQIYQIAKPHVDPAFMAENLDSIRQSCTVRGVDLDCDRTLELTREWTALKELHRELSEKSTELSGEVSRLKGETDDNYIAAKGVHDAHVKKVLECREKVYSLEDVLMPLLKKIPNVVDQEVPLTQDKIETVIGYKENISKPLTHVAILEPMLEFIDTVSPTACYMAGKLAELELTIQSYFSERFLNLGFSPLLGVDFCKSFIVEAVGGDYQSVEESIRVKDASSKGGQKLHLVGGASLETMCAYLVNMNVGEDSLPLRYFSMGRCYNARNVRSKSLDLFSLVQSTKLHALVVSEHSEVEHFAALSESLISCYKELDLPFRVVDIVARNLNPTESRRKRFDLWSPGCNEFVPVGHVSSLGDFVSRRLKVSFGVEHVVKGFCSLVEGVAVDVPVLIGCIVENYQNSDRTFDLPSVLDGFRPD